MHLRLVRSFSSNVILSEQRRSLTGSDKLFADAAREESDSSTTKNTTTSKLPFLQSQNENWTGEERIEDAVLRMLVDKYKPLRGGSIRTAEQKLKSSPPRVRGPDGGSSTGEELTESQIKAAEAVTAAATTTTTTTTTTTSSATPPLPLLKPLKTGSWSSEPLLPSSPTHKPWHTEFKIPSHITSSIKLANIPAPIPPRPLTLHDASLASASTFGTKRKDERGKKDRDAREVVRRKEVAGRLGRAREDTLDYKLGIREKGAGAFKRDGHGHGQGGGARPNPITLKGWSGLIEDRIEKARNAGAFTSLKGRGKPLVQEAEQHNPFIDREEFFMNRIVKRSGAAPPWVELQSELDTSLRTLRALLHQSYTRRLIFNFTTTTPPPTLPPLPHSVLSSLPLPHENLTPTPTHLILTRHLKPHLPRDTPWEHRLHTYHTRLVAEVNEVVRRYNAMAPYAVRRGYVDLEGELGRAWEGCLGEVLEEINRRARGGGEKRLGLGGSGGVGDGDEDGEVGEGRDGGEDKGYVGLKELVWGWFGRFLERLRVR